MAMNMFGLMASLAASVAAVWVGVDLREEPPGIVAEGDWVGVCGRVPGGVAVTVTGDAPCLTFDFVGLGRMWRWVMW